MNVKVFGIGIVLVCFHGLTKASKHAAEEVYAVLGNNISIGCQLKSSLSAFTLSWFLNSKLILFHDPEMNEEAKRAGSYTSVLQTNGATVRLCISDVQFSEAGLYSCTVDFRSSGTPLYCYWDLKVQDYPQIIMEENVITEKAVVLAECCIDFSLTLTSRNITWLISGDSNIPMTSSLPRTLPAENSERVCSTVTFQGNRQYHGEYLQCYSNNKLNLSFSSLLMVQYPPKVKILSQEYMLVEENNPANITCAGEGNPVPSIGLQFKINEDNWANLSVEAFQLLATETSSSTVFLVQIPTKGSLFRCTAFNNVGPSAFSQEVKIEVKSLAEVEMLTSSPTIVDQMSVVIKCRASGVPSPDVHLQQQQQFSPELWHTLPLEPLNENGASTWTFDMSEENYYDETFRCIANNTLSDVAISEIVVVQTRVTLKIWIKRNIEVTIVSSAVIVSILLTAGCVRYCRVRRIRDRYRTGMQNQSRSNNEIDVVYEQPPRPPTTLRPDTYRPVPRPPRDASRDIQSLGSTLPRNETDVEFSSATLPTRGTVNISVGTRGVKYATVDKKHKLESPYY